MSYYASMKRVQQIQIGWKMLVKKCPQDLIYDGDVQPCLDDERPILDLPHVRKKGITNFRIKSQLEKSKEKRK